MSKSYYIILLAVLIFSGCHFPQEEYVDFTDIEYAASSFNVVSQQLTDLSEGLPQCCYLPGGSSVNQYYEQNSNLNSRKTSSTTSSNIVQQLLKYGNQHRVIEVVGTYKSIDANNQPITLSGKVVLPHSGKPKRMILVSHYTICSNAEAPSNCFPIEGVLVKMGYGLIIPDYLGYGVTADRLHPYLVMDLTARNVLDMYLAVKPWLKAVGKEAENDDLYLMGYSQGGATTMAVEHLIETTYSNPQSDSYIKVHRVFAGGGPYDIKDTYERFITTDEADYPVAIPLVLQGMIRGYDLDVDIHDLLQDDIYNHIDEWINSKCYNTTQINQLINTTVTHNILTPIAFDRTSQQVAELYKAMTINSITSYNWIPQASVYIMHSMEDETVPYTNATNAKAKWKDANIVYNLGHYGGHTATYIRFVYAVQSLIEQEEQEIKQYE